MNLYKEAHKVFNYCKETGHLTRKNGKRAGTVHKLGYRQVSLRNKLHREHRLIWLMVTGSKPPETIDHINRIGTDNRWCNLRESTPEQQNLNRAFSKAKYTGVVHCRLTGKYIAQLTFQGTKHYLGRYDSPKTASKAYQKKLEELRSVHLFGKDQPDVVTDEDVGNFVNQLHQEGVKEVNNFISTSEEDDGVGNSSGKPSNGAEDKK